MTRPLLIFTGAGISADSGIKTFRDAGGLWEGHSVEQVATAHTWKRNADIVHAFYNARRAELEQAQPNAAHFMVQRLQDRYGAHVVTQNVDDLFEKAGCGEVVHVHGKLTTMRCEACGGVWDIGYRQWNYPKDKCENCERDCESKRGVRPGIVMFGDLAPEYARLYALLRLLKDKNGVLLVIGTSGQVVDIGGMAANHPGFSLLSNLESIEERTGVYGMPGGETAALDRYFKRVMHGRASEMAAAIEEVIIEQMER